MDLGKEVLLSLGIFVFFILILNFLGLISAQTQGSFEIRPENCSIYLTTGWNFISLCTQLDDYNIQEVLMDIEGDYEYILEWDEVTQEFRVWSRRGVREFNIFDYEKSYFIFYTGISEVVYLPGPIFESLDIVIPVGWESPVYPYEFTTQITGDSFYGAVFDYMLSWHRGRQEFEVYSTKSSGVEFDEIFPGSGLFINSEGGVIKYRR